MTPTTWWEGFCFYVLVLFLVCFGGVSFFFFLIQHILQVRYPHKTPADVTCVRVVSVCVRVCVKAAVRDTRERTGQRVSRIHTQRPGQHTDASPCWVSLRSVSQQPQHADLRRHVTFSRDSSAGGRMSVSLCRRPEKPLCDVLFDILLGCRE